MNILIRDASYEPLRKAQNATKFKEIGRNGAGKPIYQPCAPSDPTGVSMRMLDVAGDQLTLPSISLVNYFRKGFFFNIKQDDFEAALLKTKPSVSQDDLKKQEEFTQSFGIEGQKMGF